MKEYYKIYAWTECPYCIKARELLVSKDKQFMFCCIDESKKLLEHIKSKYDWLTVPLIVRVCMHTDKEEFIGGYSDLLKYFGESNAKI
tara:strand:- start:1519 stop:1782 length:264 start_codon:yes stop_codon:yes gene_type:complete